MADAEGYAQLKVRIEPHVHQHLKLMALRQGVSVSDLVRYAVDECFPVEQGLRAL